MILVAGGTGRLGSLLVGRLVKDGHAVRVLARTPASPSPLGDEVDVVSGNVRDPEAVAAAVAGVHTVISAVHGLIGKGRDDLTTVDIEGNRNLIDAAVKAGVGRFVLVSIHGAGPEHPMELARAKHAAEVVLRSSGLEYTIVRPTAYAQLWIEQVGGPLLEGGPVRLFGRGHNPINFVSVHDVSAFIANAL